MAQPVFKTKIISGLLVLILILTLLSGCGKLKGKEASADGEALKVEISFFYPRDGSEMLKKLSSEYQTLHEDIVLTLVEAPSRYDDYMEKLNKFKEDNEKLPDIMLIHDTWIAQFAENQYIRPLDGGFSNAKENDYFPGMIEASTVNGKVYGLPFWQDAPLMYYRSDLVLTPPNTWAELEQIAKNIMQSKIIENGLIFPGSSMESTGAFMSSLLMAYNAYPDFRTADSILDDSAMITVFDRLSSMVQNSVIQKNVFNMSPEDARIAFEKGKAVFMWNWSYASKMLNDKNSPFYGKVGIVPLPKAYDEMNSTGVLSGWALSMSKQTTSIPEVWSFMEYLSSKDVQFEIALDGGLSPAFAEAYSIKSWQEGIGIPAAFADTLRTGHTLMLGTDFNSQRNLLTETVRLAVAQGKGPESLLKYVKEGVIVETPEEDEEIEAGQ